MILFFAVALASEPENLRQELGGGAVVDWTRLVVEAHAEGTGSGDSATRQAVEQHVRAALGPALLAAAKEASLDGDSAVTSAFDEAGVGVQVAAQAGEWSVTEARYFASGRVELDGELSLQRLLKPWSLAPSRVLMRGNGGAVPPPTEWTGVVLDARGTGARPVFAPRVTAPDGVVAWTGALYAEAAVQRAPAVWVSSPEHPAVKARAGDRALELKAASADGGTLVLAAADVERLRSLGERGLGAGILVVIVDP